MISLALTRASNLESWRESHTRLTCLFVCCFVFAVAESVPNLHASFSRLDQWPLVCGTLWWWFVPEAAGSQGGEVMVIGFKLAENPVLKNVTDCIFCTDEYKQQLRCTSNFRKLDSFHVCCKVVQTTRNAVEASGNLCLQGLFRSWMCLNHWRSSPLAASHSMYEMRSSCMVLALLWIVPFWPVAQNWLQHPVTHTPDDKLSHLAKLS